MEGPTEEKLTGKRRLFLDWMPEQVDSLLDIGCAFSHMPDTQCIDKFVQRWMFGFFKGINQVLR